MKKERCARCSSAFIASTTWESREFLIFETESGDDPASREMAFRCSRCGETFCQKCAKLESKAAGPSVVLGDFSLCCDCGSTDFTPMPVEYVTRRWWKFWE